MVAFPYFGLLNTRSAGLGYQLASVIASGPAPLIATAILAATGSSTYISWYLIGCAVLSMTALVLLPRPPRSSEPQRAPAATPAANDPLYCRRVRQQHC
ncbi:MAG: hypothetical protein WCF33_20060 [Pseudonocardiaceae bacterium]